MIDTTHHHADNLLHGLNAQSASISDGIPLTLIQQKWRAGKRSFEQLQATLEWLFKEKLVAMRPRLVPPHVRLPINDFQQLLSAMRR